MCHHHQTLFAACNHSSLHQRVRLAPPCALHATGLACTPTTHPLHTIRVHALCRPCTRIASRLERARARLRCASEGVGPSVEVLAGWTADELKARVAPLVGGGGGGDYQDSSPLAGQEEESAFARSQRARAQKERAQNPQRPRMAKAMAMAAADKSLLRPLKVYPHRQTVLSDGSGRKHGGSGEEGDGIARDGPREKERDGQEGYVRGQGQGLGKKGVSKIPLPLKMFSYSPAK